MSWPRLHALAVMKMFYAGPDHCGSGRLVNPVPECSAEPRDHLFDALVAAMRSDRNRALLGFYVSTGAMASELLGVTVDQVDAGEQRIGVHRKVRDGCNGDPPRRSVVGSCRVDHAHADDEAQ